MAVSWKNVRSLHGSLHRRLAPRPGESTSRASPTRPLTTHRQRGLKRNLKDNPLGPGMRSHKILQLATNALKRHFLKKSPTMKAQLQVLI